MQRSLPWSDDRGVAATGSIGGSSMAGIREGWVLSRRILARDGGDMDDCGTGCPRWTLTVEGHLAHEEPLWQGAEHFPVKQQAL